MFNRTFKQKTILRITLPDGGVECADERAVKRWIYSHGRKGTYYQVREINAESGEVFNEYIYKFTEGGPIFKTKTFDLWKEMKARAKQQQYELSLF